MADENKAAKTASPVYSKEQVLASETYKKYRDSLAVCLNDDKTYTEAEIKAQLDKFLSHVVVKEVNP